MAVNTTRNSIKETIKEIDVVQYFSSDEEDDLDIALRHVREIPLEQYLGVKKAEIVKDKRALIEENK